VLAAPGAATLSLPAAMIKLSCIALGGAGATGMVTTETVHVVHYRPGRQPEAAE